MLRTSPLRRRGNCAFQILLALAVIAALLAVGGVVSMLTSGAGDAVTVLETEIKTIAQNSQSFEAPGTATVELAEGGAMLALHPDGMVGDKKIGVPPANVSYNFTITDADGNAVKFEANNAPRNPQAPFEMFGFFQAKKAGAYTIEAKTSDGSDTKAAIMVAAADEATAQRLANAGLALVKGVGGGCLAVCGCLAAIALAIPAFFVRKKAKAAAHDTLPPVG
ncbi:MAG: hypothetical protein QM516_10295 [Limnohabitans sp.]|nr:hypothetical protein [Limnohabitans sp.]